MPKVVSMCSGTYQVVELKSRRFSKSRSSLPLISLQVLIEQKPFNLNLRDRRVKNL